jgi:TPR repeat protein
MIRRFTVLCSLLLASAFSHGAAEDEWEPYRRTGLFPAEGGRWVAPEMKRESVDEFAARLLEGARGGDAKSMATLGRLFYVRGDVARAGEWLLKGAEAGHTGAQFDYGTLKAKGQGQELAEAYEWLWLATWAKEPGAEAALQQLSAKVEGWQVLLGVQRAAEFQRTHPVLERNAAAAAGAK